MSNQRLQDLESFLKTRRQFWPYEGRYSLESFGEHKYIAKIDTELAGLSWADVTAPGEAIMHMNLKKEYAEYGIGTELLETLMADLKESGTMHIRYTTTWALRLNIEMMNGSDSSGRERKNDMKNVIKEVAKKNGVSEEEVREEMQKSIHEAYLQKSPAFINTFGDREPSVEEFLKKMADQVMGVS